MNLALELGSIVLELACLQRQRYIQDLTAVEI